MDCSLSSINEELRVMKSKQERSFFKRKGQPRKGREEQASPKMREKYSNIQLPIFLS